MRSQESDEKQPVFTAPEELGDFTTSRRLIPISIASMVIGVVASFVALALVNLIGLFTNLFYFQRWSTEMVAPASHHLGYFGILVPVIGALIIGSGSWLAMVQNGFADTVFRRRSNRSCSTAAECSLVSPS